MDYPASSPEQLIVVIGRGHSGTRILAQTLYASRVFLGNRLNSSGDTVPAQPMYDACRIIGRHVRLTRSLSWDFNKLHGMRIDPEFKRLVRIYLKGVLVTRRPRKGWKLPETTLAYPWIVRMFPAAKYVYLVRDPRDCLLRAHLTDNLSKCNVPCPTTSDEIARRVISWKYQHEIVRATPQPEHFISVKFEDLVLHQDSTVQRMEAFLGIPLARVVVDKTRVGRWKDDRRILPYIEPIAENMRELGYLD
jgi:hypothetical protein